MDVPHLFDADPGGSPGTDSFTRACDHARAAVGTMRGLAAVGASVRAVERLGEAAQLAREVDLVLARMARTIDVESDVPGGGLAKHHGHRSAADLVAATMGTTRAEAWRLLEVGRALEELEEGNSDDPPSDPEPGQDPHDPCDTDHDDDDDDDDPPPPPPGPTPQPPRPRPQPRYPSVAAALDRGEISADCGSQIITMLDSLSASVEESRKRRAARELVIRARGLDATRFARVVSRFRARLDIEEQERTVARLRQARTLRIWENRAGMLVLNGELDPETAAPVRAALDALVSEAMRASRANPGEDTRTTDQMRADALGTLALHAIGCESTSPILATTTLVIRVTETELREGAGLGELDGCTQQMDIGTVRRMASNAYVMAAVLDARGALLDLGRRTYPFSRAQRIALAERDGGCAFCGAPPGWTEAHHIQFWSHGGRTDLSNGVLLCSTCHHVIHDQGWEVRATATEVWFIPPTSVDPRRKPRQGGRARFGAPRGPHWDTPPERSGGHPPGPPPERGAA